MNYYKRFVGDYMRKTMQLSMVEDGAYTRLIDWCYANESALPKGKVYQIARAVTKAERAAVDSVLQGFFVLAVDGYSQDRIRLTLAAHAKLVETNTDIGRRGGRPITEAYTETDIQTVSKQEPKQNPIHQPLTTISSKARTKPAALPPWVDPELWSRWRESRQKQRAGLTPYAESLLIKKLNKLKDEGEDPTIVIQQSIERGWKGFFPVSQQFKSARNSMAAAMFGVGDEPTDIKGERIA